MFKKYATATIISAEIATRNAVGIVKASHRAVFDYEPRPGYLYVRSRMISSRCNDNHDEFPAEEIIASWKTAKGKPAFVNHVNEDHRRMRGVIIDAALHEDTLPDGKPDIWIEALHEIDAQRFPKLAEAILAGRVNRTSMGCDVGFSVCSACGNKASTPAEYCQHIPRMKGKILYRHAASGQREGHLIREICHKLSFFENSFLVEDPADPTAVVTGVDDRGLKATASMPGQQELFSAPPAKSAPAASKAPASKRRKSGSDGFRRGQVLTWDEIGERHPGLYGDPEVHGKAAEDGDGQGIGSAVNSLAFERPDDPHGEDSSVHELDFHSELVHPDYIDNASAGYGDPRVAQAERGYESNPKQVPPLVLVHRHGVYQVADGHHRTEAASRADKKVRAYVAYSPHPDEPDGQGRYGPYHGAEEHPGQKPASLAGKAASLRKLGEYWVNCDRPGCGEHWGPDGAAGVLIRHHDSQDGQARYLLQKRAPWVDHGGTWGTPGGALHEGESPEEGAHREATEELGDLPHDLEHHRTHTDDHGGWAYHTVVMDSPERFEPLRNGVDDHETSGHGWFTRGEMKNMDLHPGFAQSLKRVTSALTHGDAIKVFPRDGKWIVADLKGETLGAHDTELDANRHRATLYRSQPDAGDRSGVQDPRSGPDAPAEIVRARTAMRKGAPFAGYEDFEDCETKNSDKEDASAYCGEIKHRAEGMASSLPAAVAYGETKAPQDVDTLRSESCPVCGEADSFDGDRCQVCNFIQPPAMFTDPDTGVAKQMDLRKDNLEQPQVGPDGQPIEGIPDGSGDPNLPNGMDPAMEGMPGMPEDQVADLFCPACGFSADTQAPMTNNDPSMASEQQGLLEGDICPNCGQATMLSPNDVGELGGEVPQEVADDADADGMPDDQELDTDQDGVPDDAEPDVDEDQIPDDAEPDQNADGVPDDAQQSPDDDQEPAGVQEEPAADAVEDEEEPQKGRKDNSRRASRRGQTRMRETMTKPKNAAAESSTIAALQQQLAAQGEILKVAGQQLHYLATLAGVAPEFEAIKAEGMKKIADIMNPAQPIPDPPASAPTETTQQAEQPETFDDPRNPGITPGSTQGVPAQQVDSPLTPGATLPTSPFNQLVDVTQPVAGTEEHVPLDQTKIETDVRVGDPMVNANDPQGYGFPLTGPFAADGAASANTTTSPGLQQRTMASIRLAKLRKGAGLITGDTDELVVAAGIEKDAALSDAMIEHEISTLDTLAKAAARRAPARRPAGGPLPKQAAAERRVPSLAGASQAPEGGLSAVAGFDDDDASDIFLS